MMNCEGCSVSKYCDTMISSVKLCKSRSVYEGLSDEELREINNELESNI